MATLFQIENILLLNGMDEKEERKQQPGMWLLIGIVAVLVVLCLVAGFRLGAGSFVRTYNNSTTTILGDQNVLMASGTLTATQLLKFVTSPPIIVAAVPGKVLNFVSGFVQFLPGTTPYVEPGNDGLQIYQEIGNDDSAVAYNENASTWMASSSIFTFSLPQFGSRAGNMTGSPFFLSFSHASEDPINGNGTLKYVVYYTVN